MPKLFEDVNIFYTDKQRTANSTYPKGGVICSKDTFVGTVTFVLLINICGKSPALRVAAKRQSVKKT
jgi:hypothetical protein